MKRVLSISLLLAMTTLLALGAFVVAAQEEPGPGEGGVIIWGNQRGSSNLGPLVPLRCSGVDCADMNALMYPDFIGLNPEDLSFQPYTEDNLVENALVTDWTVEDDGLRYVFTMREDLTWSDGVPITAEDIYFSFQAIQNGEDIGLSSSYGPARQDIASVEIVDDYTVAVNFNSANCLALNRAALLAPIPAHAFGFSVEDEDSFDFTTINGSSFDTEPTVTSGPFNFNRIEPGTGVFLEANLTYADGTIPEGLAYIDVPDYNVMATRLLSGQAGDVNFMFEPDNAVLPQLRDSDDAQVFEAPGTIWHYVALNTADPNNPQPGLDEDGNPIDQGIHPLFGDKMVRQALQHAVDIEQIIASAQNGNATAMATGTIPSAFTLNPDLSPRPFDLDEARELLDEAGWVAEGDPLTEGGDGQRVCRGCLYSVEVDPSYEGTPFVFEVFNPGDARNDVAVILQQTFAEIGLDLIPAPTDFNTMYDGNMGVQSFDAAVAGWRGGIPFNADQRSFFGAQSDIPDLTGNGEYGFNFGSWYNEEFEELSEYIFAGAAADDCSEDAIKDAAYRVQEIMYDEQPYLFLYALNSAYVARSDIEGFDPYPSQGVWNIDDWSIAPSAQ
jgi:peptide/nickel transport system substrate-binding protein